MAIALRPVQACSDTSAPARGTCIRAPPRAALVATAAARRLGPNVAEPTRPENRAHTISVVIPVYEGEHTLAPLVAEIAALTSPRTTRAGHRYAVAEVLLVYDHGPDRSDRVLRDLAQRHAFVRPVWLSRNFGAHAATLAGMASSGSDWIVTLNETGEHDPADLGDLLDLAMAERAQLVYARPTNPPPEGFWRRITSRLGAWFLTRVLSAGDLARFHNYRLVLGEIGRNAAAYCGSEVYLDVALGWVVGRRAYCPVRIRGQHRPHSARSFQSRLRYYWRLVLSAGPGPLRLVRLLGLFLLGAGLALGLYRLATSMLVDWSPSTWLPVTVASLLGTGTILFAIGVIAEYVDAAVRAAMGKPLYLIVADPAQGPLHRTVEPPGS
ncbi:MAG: glycosyltransferase [Planctomycetes bacterium]|nr:glycosyltransferase [Planctomycetota bacterium]